MRQIFITLDVEDEPRLPKKGEWFLSSARKVKVALINYQKSKFLIVTNINTSELPPHYEIGSCKWKEA